MKEAVFLLTCFVAVSLAQENYLILMPKELRPGMDHPIDIVYPETPDSAVTITADIREMKNDPNSLPAWAASSATITIQSWEYVARMSIAVPTGLMPETKYYVFLSFNGGKPTIPGKEVEVVVPPSLMFLQTDKGIYKPTETVQLRVLRMNTELQPLVGDDLKLWIKDPNNETLVYQEDFDDDEGLAITSFEVSKVALLGTYMALVEGTWGKANRTFEVAEYVMPRFEVKLELTRSYVTDPFYYGENNGDVTIEGKVIAVYTYGAYVHGTMKVTVGDKMVEFDRFLGEQDFSIKIERNNNNKDELKDLDVYAEVTEKYTDEKANKTKKFAVYDTEYRTLVIRPIPNTVEGDPMYDFYVQLIDPEGNRVDNIQRFRWRVEASLSYSLNEFPYGEQAETKYYNSESVLMSNPAMVSLPTATKDGSGAYYKSITVHFEEITTGRITLSDTFTPIKYESQNNQGLFMNIVDKFSQVQLSNTETYEFPNPEVCFKVRSSGDIPLNEVFYQVIGNYQPMPLVRMANHDIQCVDLDLDNAPKSMIMAYTLYPGKSSEYLVASVTIDVQWKSLHQVSVTMDPSRQRPNGPVKIRIQTEGRAVVGLDGIDQSLLYLAGSNSITESRIKNRVGDFRMFGKKENGGSNFPGPMPMWRDFIYPPWPQSREETTSAGGKISEAGLLFISQIHIQGASVLGNWWNEDRIMFAMADDMDMHYKDGPVFAEADRLNNAGGQPPPNNEEPEGENESKKKQESSARTEFPEVWLFDVVTTNGNGEKVLDKHCPGSITTFVVNGYGLNNQHGLGIAPTAKLTCFQPFFVTLYLPYSIVRGEDFDLLILVFNHNPDSISVTTSLTKTDHFDVLNQSPLSANLVIEPGSSMEFKVPIKAKIIGELELTVRGVSGSTTDMVIKKLRVEPEGKEIQVSQEQNAQPGSELIFDYKNFFTEPEEDVVQDSLAMYIQITGDLMATWLNNLGGDIQMPTGCGEQNMYTLVPSVYVASYFIGLGRFILEWRQKVAKYCAKGYAKELVYMHPDGSFSAFGAGPGLCGCMDGGVKEGSSWLTAFVVQVFSDMARMDLTYVNHVTLRHSYKFLVDTIDRDSEGPKSFFRITGKLYHVEMAGGTLSGAAYTAYVMIALGKYENFQKSLAASDRRKRSVHDDIMRNASTWLMGKQSEMSTPFDFSISALALVYADKEIEAKALLEKAKTAKPKKDPECPRYPPYKSCSETILPCDDDCSSGLLCCKNYCGVKECMNGDTDGGPSMVEAKGYGLLAYLALHDYDTYEDDIKELADWLLVHRKEGGRFESTQDTVIGLQALAEFATKYRDKATANFTVEVPIADPVKIHVNSDNYQSQHTEKLNILWEENMASKKLKVKIEGNSGTAFVTLKAYYNSINEEAERKVIDLTVESTKPENKSVTHIKTCIQPREPVSETDIVPGVMHVVEISLQSGMKYKKDATDLSQLETEGVTKVEADDGTGKVVLYFEMKDDELYKKRCTYIPVEKEFEVRNQAMGKVKAYDYYQPSDTLVERFYATETCEDCGPTTKGPTIGASSIYINGVLLVVSIMVALALFRRG